MNIAQNYLSGLKFVAKNIGVEKIAGVILDDPRFVLWSGSSKSNSHHYGDGGLVRHTIEVYEIAEKTACMFRSPMGYDTTNGIPTEKELFLACLYHDVGKMWDYQKVDGVWTSAPHKRVVHHVSRSAIEWCRAVDKTGECKDIEESVLHAILAHHGLREWGSPVAPKSKLAWLVHLSDAMSARMDDADKIDFIDKK